MAARTSLEKRAEDVVLLDVRALVDYMDSMLLVTGRGPRANRALAQEIVRRLKARGAIPLSRAGLDEGMWICLDYVDFVIHVFDRETREHYDLELLWADAETVPLDLDPAAVRD